MTFILKAVMALGYLVYLGGPAEALKVWSGLGPAPEPPACFYGGPACAPDEPGDVRLAVQPPEVPLETGALLRPAIADQADEMPENAKGGPFMLEAPLALEVPLVLEVNGQEATK